MSVMWSTSAGAGIPVVLVHGAFSDYRYWELQQIAFGRDYRAIAVSLPGYYPDEKLGSLDILVAEQHVNALGTFLTSLGQPAHLLGHSRGGRIALHAAARFPHAIRSLVLAEPGGNLSPGFLPSTGAPPPGIAGTDIRKEAQALIDGGKPEKGLRLYVDSGHGKGAWERSPELFRRIAIANASTIAAMIADTSAPLSRDVASAVKAPTLLIAGSGSPPLFGQILDVLQTVIPEAARVTIDGAEHFLNHTRREAFDRAVLEFWSGSRA